MTDHITKDAFNRFFLNLSTEDEIEAIEEHLLICHACQDVGMQTELHLALGTRGNQPGRTGHGSAVAATTSTDILIQASCGTTVH